MSEVQRQFYVRCMFLQSDRGNKELANWYWMRLREDAMRRNGDWRYINAE